MASRTNLSKRITKTMSPLTDRERRFVMEYVTDFNAQRAAQAAGATKKSASSAAWVMLRRPRVQAAIAKYEFQVAKKVNLRAEDALRQLYFTLTRDALDFCDETGKLITDVTRLNERARASINGIEQTVTTLYDRQGQECGERVTTKLRLVPKESAIDMAMRHKGLFEHKRDGDQKFRVDWDAIARDTQSNVVDEMIAEPLKYLTAEKIKDDIIEAELVDPKVAYDVDELIEGA